LIFVKNWPKPSWFNWSHNYNQNSETSTKGSKTRATQVIFFFCCCSDYNTALFLEQTIKPMKREDNNNNNSNSNNKLHALQWTSQTSWQTENV